MSQTRTSARWILVVVAAMVFLAACGTDEPDATLAGYERSPAPSVADVTLPAVGQDFDEFTFTADPGELLIVAFGFTSCPDICPTTLSDTRIALNQIPDLADRVDLAWVTVDPDRDSPEVVANYVRAFVPKGIALRTDDPDQLSAAANAFDVLYAVRENDEGEIEVSHSSVTFLVDDTGTVILTWPFGVTASDIANDLTVMLERQQQA